MTNARPGTKPTHQLLIQTSQEICNIVSNKIYENKLLLLSTLIILI